MSARQLPRLVLVLLALSLAGCATHYQPRYGHDGVYYDRPVVHYRAVHPDPLLYPYWSLDYFYFSRFYHPYSVLIGYYDPWYYPYPGWYYGYRAGPRTRLTISYGGYWYPWYGYGVHYHYYQPWRPRHVYYPRYTHPGWAHQPRVRQIDERLREMERRERSDATAFRGPAVDPDRISRQQSSADPGQARPERSSGRRAGQVRQRESATTRIPRRETPVLRPSAPPLRGQPAPVQRERRIERAESQLPRQGGQPSGREGVPQVRTPRQQVPERPTPPRQAEPRQQPLPPARTTPVNPPPSQPAPPPQRQTTPPPRRSEGQRSAPRRERQRERER
jgi:hypothetical protein